MWGLGAGSNFNGAETKMSRKFMITSQDGESDAVLQWGRDKNVSEIEINHLYFKIYELTSMGPRQKCLGNER